MGDVRTVGEVLAERVRSFRKAAELRQEDVAERTKVLGHTVSRVTLARIEAGETRSAGASLVEVLVLAAALDVPPPLLFLPLGDDEEVEVAPSLTVAPYSALRWVAGDEDLQASATHDGHLEAWFANSQRIRLFEGLEEREKAVHNAQAALSAEWQQRIDRTAPDAREQAEAAVAAVLAFDGPDEDFGRIDRAVSEVAGWVEAMRAAGVRSVPELPKAWQARMAKLAAEG